MLAKPDIQYVTQFYSYGSEAKVLELKPAQKKRRFALPVAMPQQKIHILVDPVAWAGILVSVVMVILMVVSANSYLDACADYAVMNNHVIELQNFNVEKQQEYAGMYDPDDIREKALALGMIPMEEAEDVFISPVIPEPEHETLWYENISWFLSGLFA